MRITIVDLETTGFPAPGQLDRDGKISTHRIASFACVRMEDGHIVEKFEVLVNPEIPMPESAGAVNGLTDAMLKWAPTFADVYAKLVAALDWADAIAGHNVEGFDLPFIWAEVERVTGKEWVWNGRVIDTMLIARHNYNFTKLAQFRSANSLDNICATWGITKPVVHDALGDCLATRAVMVRMAEEGKLTL